MRRVKMNKGICDGVWPTMITPFTEDNKVDYEGLEKIIEWYIKNGVDGLFAVCQSSEMFFLSLEERVKIAEFTVKKAAGRVPVIASGHISDSIEDQITELKAIANTGVDALVLVSNRLASKDESDDIWKENAQKLLDAIPEVPLGFYECPYPYKRLISPELLKWCADTGRFYFLKDTCCDPDQLKAKVEAVKGTGLKIFNANTATLLESLRFGVSGFSGVMANFQSNLYVWLTKNWDKYPEKADELQWFLTLSALIELQLYPVNAKYNMQLEGIDISLHTRSKNASAFSVANRIEVEQLHKMTKLYSRKLQ